MNYKEYVKELAEVFHLDTSCGNWEIPSSSVIPACLQ